MSLKKVNVFKLITFLVLILFNSFTIYASGKYPDVNAFISQNKNEIDAEILRQKYQIATHNAQNSQQLSALEIVYKILLADIKIKKADAINSESSNLFNQAFKESEKLGNLGLEAWVATKIGFFYYSYNEYVKAMPYFIKSSQLIDEIPSSDIFQACDVFRINGYFFGAIGMHSKSTHYLQKALGFTTENTLDYATLLNNIGSSYYKEGDTIKAQNYFFKTKEAALKVNDSVRYAKALGDLALISMDRKEYQKAIKLLEEDIHISEENKAERNTMYAQILLSRIYLATKEYDKLEAVLDKVDEYLKTKDYLKSYVFDITKLRLELAIQTKNRDLELQSRRILDSLDIYLDKTDGQAAVNLVNWEVQKANYDLELKARNAKIEKGNLRMWIILGSVVLLIAVVFIIVRAIQQKFKNKVAEHEKNILQYKIEQLQSQKKLLDSELTLKSYQVYLSDQTKQVKKLENELNNLNDNIVSKEEVKEFLNNLLEQQTMSDQNWIGLKRIFLKEQNEYYDTLLTRFPDLSEQEFRIVILNRMKLKPAEIALILNITIDKIEETLQRLRLQFKGVLD